VSEQIVTISPRAASFTAVCDECAGEAAKRSWVGATFAGRLDLDLQAGTFLCRRGHRVRVERAREPTSLATEAA
jgi:hypothetical protein